MLADDWPMANRQRFTQYNYSPDKEHRAQKEPWYNMRPKAGQFTEKMMETVSLAEFILKQVQISCPPCGSVNLKQRLIKLGSSSWNQVQDYLAHMRLKSIDWLHAPQILRLVLQSGVGPSCSKSLNEQDDDLSQLIWLDSAIRISKNMVQNISHGIRS